MAVYGKGNPKILAERYLRRDLYKSFDLPTQTTGQLKVNLAAKFVEQLKSNEIRFFEDVPPIKSYKQYDIRDPDFVKNILIKHDGEHVPLGNMSEVANNLPQKRVRLYFPTKNDRKAAEEIMKKCKSS